MKAAIYADNFRGFQDSLCEISRVSLLVGENSSGKSSFLALAHLLMTEDFWVKPDFNSLGHDFASFDELVSRAAKRRSYFTVGCAIDESTPGKVPFASIATFRSRDGLPVIDAVTYIHGSRVIRFWVVDQGVRWVDVCAVEALQSRRSGCQGILAGLVEIHSARKQRNATQMESRRRADPYLMLSASNQIERELQRMYPDSGFGSGFLPHGAFRSSTWFAPIRAEPRRVYEKPSESVFSPVGLHTPYLVREMLRNHSDGSAGGSAYRMIEAFGSRSGLFDELSVQSLGSSSAAPFSLGVRLGTHNFNVGEVGYGVSQVLPIVAEMYGGFSGLNIFLQQPEVHLHPRAQAELANVIFIYSAHIKPSFTLVETHSDFLIDRLRILLRDDYQGRAEEIDASIYWFERKNGQNHIHQIVIDTDGEFVDEVPAGYRDFFIRESLRGLGLDAAD